MENDTQQQQIVKEVKKPMGITLAKAFKVLIYGENNWVDMNLLSKGIYSADIPALWDYNTTMKDLIDRAERSVLSLPPSYFENLKKCELKTYYLYYY